MSQECKIEIWLGSPFSCYSMFVLPSQTFRLALTYCLDHVTRHVIISLNFGKSVIGGKFSVYWSINERFQCKLKLSTSLRLE